MSKNGSVVVVICSIALAILLGGVVGGLAGQPCQTCSVDGSRILIGAGVSAAILLAAGIYQARQRHWVTAGALAAVLLPAVYCSAVLAQKVGLWWDHSYQRLWFIVRY